jgi:uncharacterized damage-inducible protein DinB
MLARQAQTMAAYNRWMNDKLYAACAELSDADRIWFGRFTGRPVQVQSLRQELFADFNELRAERALTDQDIEGWTQGLSDAQLAAKVKFTSIVDSATRVYDLWVCVTHFFNHQTHHRGQLTTLLSQCGKDYGVTDLIWLPDLAPRA